MNLQDSVPSTSALPSGPGVFAEVTDHWDHPRSMAGAAFLLGMASEEGWPLDECLAGTGLTMQSLSEPFALLAAQQEMTLVRNVLRLSGNRPGLGVHVGRSYNLTMFGVFGYAMISSPRMIDVVRFGFRYSALTFLFSQATAEVDRDGNFVNALSADQVPADVRRFMIERDLAAMVALQRQLFAPVMRVPLNEVRLAFPPSDTGVYEEFFGAPVRFDCPRTELEFEGEYLKAALPLGNPYTVQECLELCERVRTRRLRETGASAMVRAHLEEMAGVDPGFDAVSSALYFTPRTLRRRLLAEGSSYRSIVDEVRKSMAIDLIQREGLTKAEVADRLGYRDTSSFFRALRRWG